MRNLSGSSVISPFNDLSALSETLKETREAIDYKDLWSIETRDRLIKARLVKLIDTSSLRVNQCQNDAAISARNTQEVTNDFL